MHSIGKKAKLQPLVAVVLEIPFMWQLTIEKALAVITAGPLLQLVKLVKKDIQDPKATQGPRVLSGPRAWPAPGDTRDLWEPVALDHLVLGDIAAVKAIWAHREAPADMWAVLDTLEARAILGQQEAQLAHWDIPEVKA
jgi:hypothetical protein